MNNGENKNGDTRDGRTTWWNHMCLHVGVCASPQPTLDRLELREVGVTHALSAGGGGGWDLFLHSESVRPEAAIAGGTHRFVTRGGTKGESNASIRD